MCFGQEHHRSLVMSLMSRDITSELKGSICPGTGDKNLDNFVEVGKLENEL